MIAYVIVCDTDRYWHMDSPYKQSQCLNYKYTNNMYNFVSIWLWVRWSLVVSCARLFVFRCIFMHIIHFELTACKQTWVLSEPVPVQPSLKPLLYLLSHALQKYVEIIHQIERWNGHKLKSAKLQNFLWLFIAFEGTIRLFLLLYNLIKHFFFYFFRFSPSRLLVFFLLFIYWRINL